MNRLWPFLLPELRRFPPDERAPALRNACDTALDLLELLGMAAGLVLITALTRYTVADSGLAARFGTALLNFAVALPLLVALLGPLHLRRLRRGLREQLRGQARQQGHA